MMKAASAHGPSSRTPNEPPVLLTFVGCGWSDADCLPKPPSAKDRLTGQSQPLDQDRRMGGSWCCLQAPGNRGQSRRESSIGQQTLDRAGQIRAVDAICVE